MKKVYHVLCKVEAALCGAGFVFLVIFVFLSAILRLFRVSMSWNIDLAMMLLAWTAFLGADIAWRSGQLVGIDIVTRRLPEKLQGLIQIILYVVILCALILMVVFGLRLSWMERVRTYQSIPVPYSVVTMSLVIAATSMSLSTVLKIKRCILGIGKQGGAA
jgi:TRAP-type C4-dicarboxylate transport system permease small subunit